MKRLFYLLFGLVLLPALLYAQGSLSPKDINDNLTNNYFTKTASDARYATTTYGYSSAEVDILLAPKADKTYVNATDEAIIIDNDSQDVQIESNRVAITTKADTTYVNATDETIITDLDSAEAKINDLDIINDSQDVAINALNIDVDSAEVAINLLNIDNDSQDVTIEANKVGVASLEVGLQTHQNNPTGAHAATAISATWTNVQISLDSIEAAIQSIVVGSGFALESWVNATLENNFYTQAQTNATIEAAIAAIPTPSVNQTVTVTAGEALTAGQVVSLINESGSIKAYNNPLTVSTSPNGAESVFNSAATTYCSAVALDENRFLVAYKKADNKPYSKVGTVSGSTITWGNESAVLEDVVINVLNAALISTDKVLVVYGYNASNVSRCVVLGIATSTITVNTPANFDAAATITYCSVSKLDTDVAIVCVQDNVDAKGKARVVTVSGTTPTANASTTFNAAATSYISVSALSSTSAIVAYQDGGNSNYGTAQVLSISGTTITPGTEYVYKEVATYYPAVVGMASDKAVIIYRASSLGCGVVASISGTTITYGAESASFTGDTSYNSIAKIDNTRVIIAAQLGNTYYGQSTIGNVGSSTITFDTSRTYNAANSAYNSVCYLGLNKSVIVYQDAGNSSYGTAVVNTWATSSYASVAGISQGAYSSGSDAVVLISGVSDDQSGLITGSPYFLQSNFTIGTTPVSLTSSVYSSAATAREVKVGTAKSATELVISIDYK